MKPIVNHVHSNGRRRRLTSSALLYLLTVYRCIHVTTDREL